MNAEEKRLYKLKAGVIAAAGHPIRLAIIDFLKGGEQCVCDIADHVDAKRSNVSRHLGVLLKTGIIDQRSDLRMGLKSLSMEFIGFAEFYQMVLTLVNDFMLPQTLETLIGPDAAFYNPGRKDRFKPVSQSLETEHSKEFKIRMWDQIVGRISGIPNPKTPMAINYILGQVLELMGGDFKHFKQFMLEESPEANMLYMLATNSKGMMGGQQTPMQGGPPMSNQMGIPQGMAEQSMRGV